MVDLFNKKRCYIYLRVSTAMQVDGYSLEAQEEALRKFAEGSNMEVVECYPDAGKSGKSLVGRDNFNKMLADIESEKDNIDCVLVFKLSRFGRNVRDVQNSLYVLEKHNVILHCVADGINTGNNIGKLLISIMSAIAEMEAENISQQTMAGRKQKAKNGLWNGGQAPYGYTLEKGKLVINEAEAEIVQKIYDLFTEEAYGVAGIVKYLNTHGYVKKTRGTGTLDYFTRKLVTDILDNPVYCGDITYGRRHTLPINSAHNEGRRKTIRQKEYITAEGQHDAIIEKPQFEAAQRHRASLSRTCEKRDDSTHVHLLATLVRCPICGAKMYGNTSRKKKKDGSGEYYTHYHFYGCKHRREIEGKPCTYKDNISEDKIDKPVIDVLCMLASNQTLANKIAEKVGSVTDEADVVTAIGAIQRLIDKKRAAAKSATKKILLFDDDSAGADKILEDMKEEINNLYSSIDELATDLDREKAKLAAIRENKLTTQRIYEILERFKDLYDVMSPEDRQLLMRTLVKEIHIYENVQPDNKLVKKIVLNIPIGYDGDTPYVTISPTAAGLDKKMIDESVVCLSREKANAPSQNFRIAQQDDAEHVLSLYQSAKSSAFCVWNDSYPSIAEIEHDLETKNLYVMTDGSKVIGAISVVPENELDDFDCWSCKDGKEIARVVIDKAYQGYGLSFEMVQGIASILRKNGCKAIHLSVVKTNVPAYKTYIKAGFAVVGEAQMYGNDYYLMEKAIDTKFQPKRNTDESIVCLTND